MTNNKTSQELNPELSTVKSNKTVKTEKYEKPTLEVVKFMFENDITWGSFDTSNGGDNEADVESGWWD